MASNCKACSDLREYAPEFALNGVTENVCLSLENDTGLNPSAGHRNCEDLKDAVDCLVGNMDDEIEAYEICGWKDYMHKLVPNLHNTIKAVICAVCGLWNNVCRLWCYVNFLIHGVEIDIGECYKTECDPIVRAGKGVSFLIRSGSFTGATDILLKSYGSTLRMSGSCTFFTGNKWDDADECYSYEDDDGKSVYKQTQRRGNPNWSGDKKVIAGGELAFEIEIPKEKYPFIKANKIKQGWGVGSIAGIQINTLTIAFDEGKYAYGYHGRCNTTTGEGLDGGVNGHQVKEGHIIIQMRIMSWWGDDMGADPTNAPNDFGASSGGKARTPMAVMCYEVDTEDGDICGAMGNYENCNYDLGTEFFELEYISEFGDVPRSKSVVGGYTLTAEDLPTLSVSGHTFLGWDMLAGDKINEDTVISARWED